MEKGKSNISILVPGYNYDIFISYRQKDNINDGWGRNGNRYSVIGNQYTQQQATSNQHLAPKFIASIIEGYNYDIFISRQKDNINDGSGRNGNRFSVIGYQYTQQRETSTRHLKNGSRYSVIGNQYTQQRATST